MRRIVLVILGACTWGCSSAASRPSNGAPEAIADGGFGEFVAFASNFDGYRSWPSLTVVDDSGLGGVAHLETTLVEYRNGPDAAAAPAFPQGTILVKEGTAGDPATRQAFAMVKRGGGFDSAGTVGWEWFELQNVDDAGDVAILWRGVGPPAGEVYGGNVNGDCNTCHEHAPHDGVFAQ